MNQWKDDEETEKSKIRFPGSPLWVWMELWFLSMINPLLKQWERCRHFHCTILMRQCWSWEISCRTFRLRPWPILRISLRQWDSSKRLSLHRARTLGHIVWLNIMIFTVPGPRQGKGEIISVLLAPSRPVTRRPQLHSSDFRSWAQRWDRCWRLRRNSLSSRQMLFRANPLGRRRLSLNAISNRDQTQHQGSARTQSIGSPERLHPPSTRRPSSSLLSKKADPARTKALKHL